MRHEINRLLQSQGLGRLEDGQGLCSQLGYLVRDHEHFRSLLTTCDPAERRTMYEALRPSLRFAPKPLDVYVSEAAQNADDRQLPTVDPESGQLRAWHAPEIGAAQAAVAETFDKQKLWLVCRKCTREAVFTGTDKGDAIHAARSAGWTYGLDAEGKGREICPECPAGAFTGLALSRTEFEFLREFKKQSREVIEAFMPIESIALQQTFDHHAANMLKAARSWDATGRPDHVTKWDKSDFIYSVE